MCSESKEQVEESLEKCEALFREARQNMCVNKKTGVTRRSGTEGG